MKQLFNDFSDVSTKQWKQQIQFELNGADYNENLVWNSPESIKVKPFYNNDDLSGAINIHRQFSTFTICQNIFVHNVEKSNYRAIQSIKQGSDSIRFSIENDKIDFKKLLSNIDLEKISIYFNFSFLSTEIIKKLESITKEHQSRIYFNLDPIGQLAKEGNWFQTKEKNNFETLNQLSKEIENASLIRINSSLYQNSGANMVQQIAYSLAHANEYLNKISQFKQPIVFEVAVGSNYFFEIAKLRALRLLFQLISKEYDHPFDCHLFVAPTKRNKTIYDFQVNILRTTSETMCAILGGADSIANMSFDAVFLKDNQWSTSIARNQLLILKNECLFDKVNNPVEGSYFIESLTNQMAEKALVLFKEIEAHGGFLKLLIEGTIKKKIQESASKEEDLYANGNEILFGTTKYINPNDSMKNKLELFPFVKIKPRKTLISPIIEKRVAEKVEQDRLSSEIPK